VPDVTLTELVERAIEREPCEAILLSGGLDTSVVATLAVRHGLRFAVTVVAGEDAPDLAYATAIAERLGIEHVVLRRSLDELAAALPELIGILGTFDGMYLRNDVVVLEGLKEVARQGFGSCWTGDAADELFAGYSFMFERPAAEIEATVKRFAGSMQFNGPRIGERLGVAVRSPYLDPAVVAFALGLRGDDLVLERDGRRLGKAPLRREFAPALGDRHAYRRKDPIEVGSGATALKTHVRTSVADFATDAAAILATDRVRIRDAESLAYYRMYRAVFGGPPPADATLPKRCPDCGARGPDGTYCRVCGAYPI
jgi:asparagine synthase (glutamine-hydrolysing)